LALSHQPAVDTDELACDERRLVAREEHDDVGNLLGACDPSERVLLAPLRQGAGGSSGAASAAVARNIGVSTEPGHTATTRMFSSA
jgi:hypothetical protein